MTAHRILVVEDNERNLKLARDVLEHAGLEVVCAGSGEAAMTLAGDADVILMAHYGFPDGFGEAWRRLGGRNEIEVQLWHVPASELPVAGKAGMLWQLMCSAMPRSARKPPSRRLSSRW